jgi:hypothetical protein
MNKAFGFFLRLFLCFVGAKFLLEAVGVGGRGYLVALTLLFVANVYWFSHLVFRPRPPVSAAGPAPVPPAAASPVAESPAPPPPPET